MVKTTCVREAEPTSLVSSPVQEVITAGVLICCRGSGRKHHYYHYHHYTPTSLLMPAHHGSAAPGRRGWPQAQFHPSNHLAMSSEDEAAVYSHHQVPGKTFSAHKYASPPWWVPCGGSFVGGNQHFDPSLSLSGVSRHSEEGTGTRASSQRHEPPRLLTKHSSVKAEGETSPFNICPEAYQRPDIPMASVAQFGISHVEETPYVSMERCDSQLPQRRLASRADSSAPRRHLSRLRLCVPTDRHTSGVPVHRRSAGTCAPQFHYAHLAVTPPGCGVSVEAAAAMATTGRASSLYHTENHPSSYAIQRYRDSVKAVTGQDSADQRRCRATSYTRVHSGWVVPRDARPSSGLQDLAEATQHTTTRLRVGPICGDPSSEAAYAHGDAISGEQKKPNEVPLSCLLAMHASATKERKRGMLSIKDGHSCESVLPMSLLAQSRRWRAAQRFVSSPSRGRKGDTRVEDSEQRLYWAEHATLHGPRIRGLNALLEGIGEVEPDLSFSDAPASAYLRPSHTVDNSPTKLKVEEVEVRDSLETLQRGIKVMTPCSHKRRIHQYPIPHLPCTSNKYLPPSSVTSDEDQSCRCDPLSPIHSARGDSMAGSREGDESYLSPWQQAMEDSIGLVASRLTEHCTFKSSDDAMRNDAGCGYNDWGRDPCRTRPESRRSSNRTANCDPNREPRGSGVPLTQQQEVNSAMCQRSATTTATDPFVYSPLLSPLLLEVNEQLLLHQLPSINVVWRWGAADQDAVLREAGFQCNERNLIIWEIERSIRVSSTMCIMHT